MSRGRSQETSVNKNYIFRYLTVPGSRRPATLLQAIPSQGDALCGTAIKLLKCLCAEIVILPRGLQVTLQSLQTSVWTRKLSLGLERINIGIRQRTWRRHIQMNLYKLQPATRNRLVRALYLAREADKFLGSPIFSTAERILLTWVKEVRTTKS
jgi:hypothetical protein